MDDIKNDVALDVDVELIRLRKMRAELSKEMAQAEVKRTKDEYIRLAGASIATALSATAVSLTAGALLPLFSWHSVPLSIPLPDMRWVAFGIALAVASIFFVVRARQSALSIKTYLKIDGNLLVNEMPNIFQIISSLGLVSAFLKAEWVKLAVAVILAVLLLIYLTVKRGEMLSASKKLKNKVEARVTAWGSIVLGLLLTGAVYELASLISAQIT